MAADEPATATVDVLVDRYEQLRRHALDGDGQGWRLGLALLHRRGVAGWLHAWQDLPAAPVATPASTLAIGPGDAPLVGVLASMALACVTAG
ncbi:MAG: hypothetical protein ACR2KP_02540 [Egibacteraceae bacterium]